MAPEAPATPAVTSRIRVIYLANRQGEIEPCGCQVNQIGGMHRLQTFLLQQRSQGPLFIGDAGDTFFSLTQLHKARREQEIMRAKVIARSYRKNHYTQSLRIVATGVISDDFR